MTKNIKESIKKKIILIVLDGFGIGENDKTNAIYQAKPKFYKKLLENYPNIAIDASEEAVGLPNGQPGNSEVGHLTLGAGRIVYTGLSLITNSIQNNTILKNKELIEAVKVAKKNKGNIHLLGLTSKGNVHSSINHLFFLIDYLNSLKITPILDLITDGRDCPQKEFINELEYINEKYIKTNKAIIGSISGRYYAMDRNENWDRTELYLNSLITERKDSVEPIEYVKKSYEQDVTDEFIIPKSFNDKKTTLKDNDVLICFNFRSDRMKQISDCFIKDKNYKYKTKTKINPYLVTFMDYKIKGLKHIMFHEEKVKDILSDVLEANNLKQLRVAETEKYAHVTYFFNALNNRKPNNCDSHLIPSPSVKSYDLTPKMSAEKITDYVVNNYKNYDFILINYANGDMVGHTGKMKPTKKAIKCLDKQLKQLAKIILDDKEYTMIITADHGNCDKMLNKNGIILTSHSINKVPFIVLDHNLKLAESGSLANVAPTIIELMGLKKPKSMAKSLIKGLVN